MGLMNYGEKFIPQNQIQPEPEVMRIKHVSSGHQADHLPKLTAAQYRDQA